MCEYLAAAGLSHYDEFGDGFFRDYESEFRQSREVMGLIGDWDRTLEMPVVIVALFTTEFVRHIQKTFLVEYPFWRLELVGTRLDGEEERPDLPRGRLRRQRSVSARGSRRRASNLAQPGPPVPSVPAIAAPNSHEFGYTSLNNLGQHVSLKLQ